ncbi:MAG: prohead protease/major capsid protein fusion protein [Archangium sp.]
MRFVRRSWLSLARLPSALCSGRQPAGATVAPPSESPGIAVTVFVVKIHTRRLTVGTIDVDQRTAEVVFTTGAGVRRFDPEIGEYQEVLSLAPGHIRLGRLNSGAAPLLADHSGREVVDQLGVVVAGSARVEGLTRGLATVRFAPKGMDPVADTVFEKVAARIVRNISVGYSIHRVELQPADEGAAPVVLITDWEPFELSVVTVPADPGAGFRSLPLTRSTPQAPRMNHEQLMALLASLGITLTPAQTAKLQAAFAPQDEQPAAEARSLAANVELERITSIRSLVTRAAADRENFPKDLAQRLIASGASDMQVRAAILDALVDSQVEIRSLHSGEIDMGKTDGEKFGAAMVAAMFHRTGRQDIIKKAIDAGVAGFSKSDLDGGHFRAMSLADMARVCLERRGVRSEGWSRSKIVGTAFAREVGVGHRFGGSHGTSDFPVLLENALGKLLMAGYATAPDTWSLVCRRDEVPDFRAAPRYRQGFLGTLERVSEHGEFKNIPVPDGAKTTIQTSTKGGIISITRQAIVNDDMSALSDLPVRLGRAAKLSIEADFFALLAENSGLGPTMGDGNPFFHSSRGNVNGTGSGLTAAGIDADRSVMAAQKDLNNVEFLDVRPRVLLVPTGLGAVARILNTSAVNPDGGAGKSQLPNPVQGLFDTVADTPRLSGNRRYLFADPLIVPAFVVAFLEGQNQSPIIESDDGWRIDGTELRVKFDYFVQTFDPKGGVTNVGA